MNNNTFSNNTNLPHYPTNNTDNTREEEVTQTQYSPYTQHPQEPNWNLPNYPQTTGTPYNSSQPVNEPPLHLPWYGIGLIDATKRFFKKYATFSGRASRSEFWWSYLATTLIGFAVGILTIGVGSSLWSLATLIPSLAIAVRRLHDTNRSGWWLLAPIGMMFISVIPMFIAFAASVSISDDGYIDENEIGQSFIFAVIATMVIMIASFAFYIYLMAAKSHPDGIRFDENLEQTMRYAAPTPTYTTTQTPYTTTPQPQAAFNEYTTPNMPGQSTTTFPTNTQPNTNVSETSANTQSTEDKQEK
ncbi:MAG: DUF805 domain-containing protein [Actinomycetaceae bacterium]|nr:DUF805 domain-containing protein [Actinomycetaceae bacterium]